MSKQNIGEPDQPEGEPKAGGTSSHIENHQPGNNGNKRYSDGRILAINLIILVVYTGLCALTSGGPFFDAFFTVCACDVLFCSSAHL